jgi:hypothetical protein
MDYNIYYLLTVVCLFYTYLSFSKNADQTDINKVLAGLLWIFLAFNTLVISFIVSDGSPSGFSIITRNSTYWQNLTAVMYGVIGVSIWIHLVLDRMMNKAGAF